MNYTIKEKRKLHKLLGDLLLRLLRNSFVGKTGLAVGDWYKNIISYHF